MLLPNCGRLFLSIALMGGIAGCSQTTPTASGPAKGPSDKPPQAANDHSHTDHDHDHDKDETRIRANLAKLSESDRALAEKQHLCPVSGDHLGTMGVPLKVLVKGETVLICCESCRAPLTEDPDKYLAKLKEHGESHE
jgi:Cu(I)/Ag(I) efflux system membrane fusion protein